MNKRSQIEIIVIFIIIMSFSFITYNAKLNHVNEKTIEIIRIVCLFGFFLFGGKYYENIKEVYYKKAYGFGMSVGLLGLVVINYIWAGSLSLNSMLLLIFSLIGIVFSFKSIYRS
jgi:hypothetical protein